MAPELTAVRRTAAKAASSIGERDTAIRNAHRAGHTLRDIAAAAGLSHQRVHQIVAGVNSR